VSTEVGLLESYVQVPPDSTGKKIRNVLVTVPAADGSSTTAYMQVIGIADADGFPIGDPTAFQQEMLELLRDIKKGIEMIAEELT